MCFSKKNSENWKYKSITTLVHLRKNAFSRKIHMNRQTNKWQLGKIYTCNKQSQIRFDLSKLFIYQTYPQLPLAVKIPQASGQ